MLQSFFSSDSFGGIVLNHLSDKVFKAIAELKFRVNLTYYIFPEEVELAKRDEMVTISFSVVNCNERLAT